MEEPMGQHGFPLMAVDVGNRRMKFGWFGRPFGQSASFSHLPEPESVFFLEHSQEDWRQLEAWLEGLGGGGFAAEGQRDLSSGQPLPVEQPDGRDSPIQVPVLECCWWIGSVNRPAAARLVDWLQRRWPHCSWKLLQWTDLPIQVRVPQPERVGIDRVLNAVAANRLRAPDRPAVVVDMGTAITVDWISAEGAFCGGAILPGLEMSARALHEFTDLLPEVSFTEPTEPPPLLGTHTEAAIRSGLFWGTVGAIREFTYRLAQQSSAVPQLFLTGGASRLVAHLFGPECHYVPHLTLAGIALTALAS